MLITAGVLVLLFIAWQLWFTEWTVGSELNQASTQQSQEWNAQASARPSTSPSTSPSTAPTGTPDPAEPTDPTDPTVTDPPVGTPVANAKRFGMLIVPRWGADYYRPIAEGIGVTDVLNKGVLGHYPSTAMPGGVGNFAIAAHRMGHGGSLHYIHELQLGDNIYVETAEGWYEYQFRNLEYVRPSGVGVIDPVPQSPETPATERYITLTSCNPMYTSDERIIAYGVYENFYPRDTSAPNNGAPDEIAATVGGA